MQPIVLLSAMALLAATAGANELGSTRAPESTPPDGSISITGGIAALGVGFIWGRGTLTYHGQQFGFQVRGVDIGDVAAAHVEADGEVYHLACLADFSGTYTAVSTGAALLKGAAADFMQNEHGAVIEIHSHITGLRANLSASRLHITLDSEVPCRQP